MAGCQIWAIGGLITWVIWCFAKKICIRHVVCVGGLLWWSCQSPVAHSCSLLNHLDSFCTGMFKLNSKFDADSLLYALSHFEWDSHTVHMLTQWCLLAPLKSRVKSSLFTHVHSCPLSLAARLHRCLANHAPYMKPVSSNRLHAKRRDSKFLIRQHTLTLLNTILGMCNS